MAGQKNKKDITGQVFGKLTALKCTGNKKYNSYVWECVCDCGNKVAAQIGSLMSGNTKSCGCVNKERIIKHNKEVKRLPNNMGAFNTLYYKYKQAAKRRDVDFNISKEQFAELIKKSCHYCGTPPNKKFFQDRCDDIFVIYNGIDRVDNEIGYHDFNCVACCTVCNSMKLQMGESEFYNHIEKIYQHIRDRITNIKITEGVIQ